MATRAGSATKTRIGHRSRARARVLAVRLTKGDREAGTSDGPVPRSSLHLVPPALTPTEQRKRLPSPQAVRRRYKLAQWGSVLVGGLVAAIVIAAAFANLTARKLSPDQTLYAFALLVLVIGFGLPWLVVKVLWVWKRRRHDWGS